MKGRNGVNKVVQVIPSVLMSRTCNRWCGNVRFRGVGVELDGEMVAEA